MEIGEAYRELNSYSYLMEKERDIWEEILRLENKCTKITTTFSDMPKGGYNRCKMEDAILDLLEETDKYFDILKSEKEIKERINDKLDVLEKKNYKLKTVLFKRYMLNKDVDIISTELKISERHVRRLLELAVIEYSKL